MESNLESKPNCEEEEEAVWVENQLLVHWSQASDPNLPQTSQLIAAMAGFNL